MWNKYEPPMRNLSMKFVTLTTSFTNYCDTQSDLEFARKMYLTAIQSIWRKLRKNVVKLSPYVKPKLPMKKKNGRWKTYVSPSLSFLIEDKNNSADVLRDLWCEYFSEEKFKNMLQKKEK